jgi:hypothetical protein
LKDCQWLDENDLILKEMFHELYLSDATDEEFVNMYHNLNQVEDELHEYVIEVLNDVFQVILQVLIV